ncbi:MAG TPA: fused MFS/spermidine synthase [Pyrinomonadaceae bacterium]|nr:fused MFS/spermidine synthase [Pyrinomonadaceae bacterium]
MLRKGSLTFLFGATLFVGAGLLFWVEPVVAKMLLPLLGGAPSVWNTCLLFFQTLLLVGYAYALFATRRLTTGQQAVAQIALLAVAALALPVAVSASAAESVPREGDPSLWLLGRLFATIGLPFFALATLSPLLQKWFSATGHESARDPYFLYAASNAGSLAALVGFPVLLEPLLPLARQGRVWAFVYGALVLLVAACAFVTWRGGQSRAAGAADESESAADDNVGRDEGRDAKVESADALRPTDDAPSPAVTSSHEGAAETLTLPRRLRWVALAFVPSSLMLGVTTYLSTDIASLPLLWVVPLSLYLITLILVFARRRLVRQRWAEALLPGVALVFTLVYLSGATQPALFLALLHLVFFFAAALMCHGRLADDRPSPSRLAEYYLWMSLGGALGGLFNALVAPVLFERVVEYPLAVVLACALLPARKSEASQEGDGRRKREIARVRLLDLGFPAALGALTLLLALLVSRTDWETVESLALVAGVPLILCYLLRRRPVRFALALGAVMLGGFFWRGLGSETVYAERNFFGTVRVVRDEGEELNWLYHGTTIHGRQSTRLDARCEPLSYYHPKGPLAQVFSAYNAQPPSPNVAVVGLGTGATAAYARAGQRWFFYEINPAVVTLATAPDHFTYLSSCASGVPVEVVLGDARLRLADAAPGAFGLIVLDAFSSDAIPVHLMTAEALDLYLSRLAPGGLVAYHVSNRSLNLHPVVADLARSRNLSAVAFNDNERLPGKEPSHWVVVARRPEDLATLSADARWRTLEGDPSRRLWTDDYSNIVTILKW